MENQQVYWVEGDGIGPDIWAVTRPVLDAAVETAYAGKRRIEWTELLAGEKSLAKTGELLPDSTIHTLEAAQKAGSAVAIKGPLGTPVGTGFRSLNVALRQIFDLYACIRPVRYFPGIVSPVKRSELVDMVIFRENTEDVYAGIEYAAKTPEAEILAATLGQFGAKLPKDAAIGVKPMSEFASKRLVRRAIQYALDNNLPSVTLVHKGNIMKYTEGAFRAWGYEVAAEFGSKVITEKDYLATQDGSDSPYKDPNGRVIIKDKIADAMFQEALRSPQNYSVLATPNLNGDYLSDALAAQVGGLGMAPGVNMSDTLAFFEATHGTAPNSVGKDRANPCSLLLSGALMLRHLGWQEAALRVENAVQACIDAKTLTPDLAKPMQAEGENATAVSCSAFGQLLLGYVKK